MEIVESNNYSDWNDLTIRRRRWLRFQGWACRFAPELVLTVIYLTYVLAQNVSQASRFAVQDAAYTHLVKLVEVAVGLVSLQLLAGALRRLLSMGRRVASALIVLALFGYVTLCFYNWKTNSALTFALLADHFHELRHAEAWVVVSDQLEPGSYLTLAVTYAGLWLIEWKTAMFRRALELGRRSWLTACGCGVGWLLLVIWGPVTLEPATLLARSAWGESFRLRQFGLTVSTKDLAEFPYVREPGIPPTAVTGPADRPHVFVIMIESFNARFVDEHAADGTPLMPHFQAAIRNGAWVEPFYGNATYTLKGQEAVLTSLPPTLSGNLANDYGEVRIRALPTLFREAGYETRFFQAYKDIDFAGTGDFMRRCGFEFIQAMDQEFTKTMDPALFWNWGIRDDAFYDRFFAWLRERDPNPASGRQNESPKPLFALLATISSHSPYDQLPRSFCEAFPQPTSKAEWYANALRLVDRGIGRFLENLEQSAYGTNAIVVITGDHGIPMAEHGVSSLQSGFFEESFRVPCLILWPGKLAPQRIEGGPFSQLDLAPTLLDLCGIQARNHCTGRSVFEPVTKPRAAVMLQSYDGLYLVARVASWKYVFHNATGREFIFDLARDPQERLNRFGESPSDLRHRLREAVGELWLYNQLLAENRIWPEADFRPRDDGHAVITLDKTQGIPQ